MEQSEFGQQQATAGYCRACGQALLPDQVHLYQGVMYCATHVPPTPSSPASPSAPSPKAPAAGCSPALAFLLGLIPGVGAIYNGQYAKGFVHVLITALLINLANQDEPFGEMLVPIWFFYMAFEAYHTAKKRLLGESVDEFSSIFPTQAPGFPLLPVLLIALGTVFLLNNLNIISIRRLIPYAGPLFLIALGAYMLYVRLKANAAPEVSHERN